MNENVKGAAFSISCIAYTVKRRSAMSQVGIFIYTVEDRKKTVCVLRNKNNNVYGQLVTVLWASSW